MGADPTGKVSRLFGVFNEDIGLDLRGTFIISPKGILTCSEVNFYNMGRNIDELMRKFKANLYLQKKSDEAFFHLTGVDDQLREALRGFDTMTEPTFHPMDFAWDAGWEMIGQREQKEKGNDTRSARDTVVRYQTDEDHRV